MAENSSIEWTDHTFNPWIGCTRVSPGCDNCYAATQDKFRSWTPDGWGGPRRRTGKALWAQPARWNSQHGKFFAQHGRRQRVFCASLGDVFDNQVPQSWRDDLFAVIEQTPNLDWQLLTKRIGNVAAMLPWSAGGQPWPHVWLGATIVNQEEADRDIPKLLATPARVRFLSMEPLLGEIDLTGHLWGKAVPCSDCPRDADCMCGYQPRNVLECMDGEPALDWVIVGGESGPGARSMNLGWAKRIVGQCSEAGVSAFVKQMGAKPVDESGARIPVSDRKGKHLHEWPVALQIRSMPL